MKNIFLSFLICFASITATSQVKTPDSTAINIFDKMSEVIGEFSSLSFTLDARNDEVNQDLGVITTFSQSKISFNGPNQLQIHSKSDKGHRGLWFEKDTLTYYSFKENNFVIIPSKSTTIDMIDDVHERYGIDFPAADFFSPTFTDDILANFDELKFVGLRQMCGTECFYILAKRDDMVVQFWIANDALNLPVKAIITEKKEKETMQHEITFSDWDINPFLPNAMFQFQPPPSAKEISILPRK
jgi:hypothetical protein